MNHCLYLMWLLITSSSSSGFVSSCLVLNNSLLDEDNCSDLTFHVTDKDNDLPKIDLQFHKNNLTVAFVEKPPQSAAYLRISNYHNDRKQFCTSISGDTCVTFGSEMINEAFLLELKIEELPEISSRRIVFSVPSSEASLFLYVDFTVPAHLILKGQRLGSSSNISDYKVQAFKDKNNITTLLNLQHFSGDGEVSYDIFTYNEEGNYYFNVDSIYDGGITTSSTTPKIFVGRRKTRLVIGIVGASFILPFVLFVFHILTKKYPDNESGNIVVITHKSSIKKHNDLVASLANFIQKMNKSRFTVDIINLSKLNKKAAMKSINCARSIIFVAPPIPEHDPVSIPKAIAQKEIVIIIFDHCTDKLPNFLNGKRTFRLLEDLEKFERALNLIKSHNGSVFDELRKKTEEAKVETDLQLNADVLPKIIITNSEPEEYDALIGDTIET